MLTPRPKNLGLADLEPVLDALAASLRAYHPPELHVWALMYLANELGLWEVTAVGDPDDPEFTADLMWEVAQESLRSRGSRWPPA